MRIEVEESALDSIAEMGKRLQEERDELLEALMPLAMLLQNHNNSGPDEQPIFGINSALITLGDLRKANILIARCNSSPKVMELSQQDQAKFADWQASK